MYYFAYGSNMVFEQMRRLCGWHFEALGMGILQDYELGADKRGYMTAHKKPGSKVYGVLYSLDQCAIDALDEFEGHPNVFIRDHAKVMDIEGNTHTTWIYAESPEMFGGEFVKKEFLNRIAAAAEASRLPQQWLDFLHSFKTIEGK